MSVQRLKVAILPLDLPCSGPVTHSGEILTTGKSHGKKPDRFSLNDDTDVKKVLRFKYATLDFILHLNILWSIQIMNPHFILFPRPKYRPQPLDFENNPWCKHWGVIKYSVTKGRGSKLPRHVGKCTIWHSYSPDNETAQPVTFPQGGKTRFTRGLLRKWKNTLQPAI